MPALILGPSGPQHAAPAAELIYASGPRVWDFVFRPAPARMLPVISALARARRSLFAWPYHTLAFRDGRVVGLELGYATETRHRLDWLNFLYFLPRVPPRAWVHLLRAPTVLATVLPDSTAGSYYLSTLAVAPDCRSQGVGERLLEHAFERARARGFPRVELDVAVTNRAKRLYERVGMEARGEARHPEYERIHDIPGHFRMVIDL